MDSFFPADDYAIFVHFAEAASDGQNPYALPEDYRSKTVPLFFTVGWTQPEPGLVRQAYADHMPLLMLVNSWIFRLHHTKGLYWWFILLYAVSCILYCIYAYGRRNQHKHHPLVFLIFMALNPLIIQYSFRPIEDKILFLFLLLIALLVRHKPLWLILVLAVLASLKGIGLFVCTFYIAYLFFNKMIKLKYLIGMVFLFAILYLLPHMLWFPECLNAYELKAGRWNWTGHDSLFLPLDMAGLFWKGIPKILIGGAYLLLGYATIKRKLTLQEVILLPVAIYIMFTPDLSFDRLLVAIFCLLLLSERNLPILLFYLGGILVTTPGLTNITLFGKIHAEWLIIWSLTLYLVVVDVRQIFRRKSEGLTKIQSI